MEPSNQQKRDKALAIWRNMDAEKRKFKGLRDYEMDHNAKTNEMYLETKKRLDNMETRAYRTYANFYTLAQEEKLAEKLRPYNTAAAEAELMLNNLDGSAGSDWRWQLSVFYCSFRFSRHMSIDERYLPSSS